MDYQGRYEKWVKASTPGYTMPPAEEALLLDIRDLLFQILQRTPEPPKPEKIKQELLAEEVRKVLKVKNRDLSVVVQVEEGAPMVVVTLPPFGILQFVFFQELNGNWMAHARRRAHGGVGGWAVVHREVVANGEDLANVAKHIRLFVQGFDWTGKVGPK